MSEVIEGPECSVDGCTVVPYKSHIAPENPDRKHLQIDIVSDAICPWCYVAKRHLERALPTLQQHFEVRIRWHPFQLNPGMPKEGMDRRAYRSAKFGSWDLSQHLDAEVAQAGRHVGLDFHHERIERMPNTFDAHRLIWLAGQNGVQGAVVEGLFTGYFTQGVDVGQRTALAEVAEQAGLVRPHVLAYLNSEAGTGEVRAAEAVAHRAGVSSVPTFVVNGQVVFSGALRTEVMLEHMLGDDFSLARRQSTPTRLAD